MAVTVTIAIVRPYSEHKIHPFVRRLGKTVCSGEVKQAVVLVNSATDTAWFHELASYGSAMYLVKPRIPIWHPDKPGMRPWYANVFVYLGSNPERFCVEFAQFNMVIPLEKNREAVEDNGDASDQNVVDCPSGLPRI